MTRLCVIQPIVGQWYSREDRPQPFQVVAVDEVSGSVDIEYFDGTIDEWPAEHWQGLQPAPCEAPRDWSGPFDDLQPDDLDSDAETAAMDRESVLQRAIGRDALELEPPGSD